MPDINREPPGPRRINLALAERGFSHEDVANLANCERSWATRVVGGDFRRETDLVRRVKAQIIRLTGRNPAWLFAHHKHSSTGGVVSP